MWTTMDERTPASDHVPGGLDRTMFRRRHLAVAAFVVLTALATAPVAAPAQAGGGTEAVEVVHIEGRGHGHGVGLSQWGAHTMARRGSSAADILATFYPGTRLGSAAGEITVRVDRRSVVHVSFPDGGEIRAGRDGSSVPGFPVTVPSGGIATIRVSDSGYEVTGAVVGQSTSATALSRQIDCPIPFLCPTTSTTSTTVPDHGSDPDGPVPDDGSPDTATPETTATAPPEGPPVSPDPVWAVPDAGGTVTSVDRGRNYRGVLRVADGIVTNHVDVEDYLRGMVEMPGHWPPAAVQAQTIAARTFALRAMAVSGSICDTDACQVYLGTARESAGLDAAVAATAGTVVYYGDGLAATFFSASAGGVSATPLEGFGNATSVPYLQAVEHPDDHPQPWILDVPLTEIGARFGYPGAVDDVRVGETGPSGRPLSVVIDGDEGELSVDAHTFGSTLDLRSTLFTLELAMSDGSAVSEPTVPTTPPVDTAGVQAPVAGEPIPLAVAPLPGGDVDVPWPWPTAAAVGIVVVVGGGILGFHGGGARRRRMVEARRRLPGIVGPWKRSAS